MCTTKRKSQCTPAKGDANQPPGHAKPYIQDQGISQSVIHLLRYWGGVLYRWRLALAEDQETFVPSPLCTANLIAIIFRGWGSLLTPGKQWCRISGQASLRLRSSTSEICSQPRSWLKKGNLHKNGSQRGSANAKGPISTKHHTGCGNFLH